MNHILYYKNLHLRKKYFEYLAQLPPKFQRQIVKFRNPQDAERCLAGKLLLQEGLKLIGCHKYKLKDLKYSAYQRPYFDHTFDFNIAHSGDYIVCAISKTNKVGVDIEEVRPTTLQDFRHFFTGAEWSKITGSEENIREFYTLWTQKEATMKASGEGMSIPSKEIFIREHEAVIQNEKWYLSPLKLSPNYISYLATDSASSEFNLQQIHFE